jgi:hypothetical protein
MTDFAGLLRVLVKAEVEFIVIGGVAAAFHGAIRTTRDLDVVYRRTPGNVARLVEAISPLEPYPRGAPPGLPFLWEAETIMHGLNFTLTTSLGDLDILGEVTGGGMFEGLVGHATSANLFGVACLCLDLDTLIHVKRAAGRPKDFEGIAELEALREEREAGGG